MVGRLTLGQQAAERDFADSDREVGTEVSHMSERPTPLSYDFTYRVPPVVG